tara:strand:- start:79 stop:267 length:189 start_codon:yes stop_codon:yes gene_type:complete
MLSKSTLFFFLTVIFAHFPSHAVDPELNEDGLTDYSPLRKAIVDEGKKFLSKTRKKPKGFLT